MTLDAPEMSFGSKSFSYKKRETLKVPTSSALMGIICCAMGIKIRAPDSDISELDQNISFLGYTSKRSEASRVYTDFVTCGSKLNKKDPLEKRKVPRTFRGELPAAQLGTTKTYEKEYLQDFSFKVLVEIKEDYLAESVYKALKDPAWPLFIGRKCCIPTTPILDSSPLSDTEREALLSLQVLKDELLPVEQIIRYY